jgi:hypothetical protein
MNHLYRPPDESGRSVDRINLSAHVGVCWKWAHDPANATDSLAASVRLLLAEMCRLADLQRVVAEQKVELDTLRSHNAAYRRRFERNAG